MMRRCLHRCGREDDGNGGDDDDDEATLAAAKHDHLHWTPPRSSSPTMVILDRLDIKMELEKTPGQAHSYFT